MTFEAIWESLCSKKPDLRRDGTITEFESQNLRRLIEQVYEQGVKAGKESLGSTGFDPFADVMKQFRGF